MKVSKSQRGAFSKGSTLFKLALLLFANLISNNNSAQTTVSISASADTKLDSWATTTNYGSATDLQTYPWVLSNGNYTRRILIKFDLSSIPTGATITSATLHLYETGTRGYNRTLAAHKVLNSWSETSVTTSSFGNAFNATASATAQLEWPNGVNGSWDLKNDVQSFVYGTSNYGWLIKDNSEDDSQSFWQFASREYSTSSLRPVLTVAYTAATNPTLNVSPSTSICAGGSTQLTASGASTYNWSPATGLSSANGATVTASPSSTTTYTVTGAFPSGQTSTKTVTVTVNNNPTISVSPSASTITIGQSVQLTANGASSYVWLPSIGLSANSGATVIATASATILYTVNGTDNNGCVGSKNVTITVQELSSPCDFSRLTANVTETCLGDSTGSIKLSGLDNVFTGKMSIYDCNAGTPISGNNIVVNSGEIKRISTTANANITINGGVLVTCGSVTVSSINITNGGILSINGGIAFNCNVNIPENGLIVNNYGSVAFYQAVNVEGTLLNLDGSMATYSTLTNSANGAIINNSQFTNAIDGTSLPNNFSDSASRAGTITWSGTTQTGEYIVGLPEGTYTATIFSGSCSINKTYTVGTLTRPQLSATKENNTDSLHCNGKLSGSVIGGTAPYYFRCFDNSQHTFSFNSEADSLCAGNYTLLVIDKFGCSTSGSYNVINDFYIPIDTTNNGNNNGGDTTSTGGSETPPDESFLHSSTPPIDSVAFLMKSAGMNTFWNLSGIAFSKYTFKQKSDSIVHSNIPSFVIMNTYHPFFGEIISNQFNPKIYNQFSLEMTRAGNYSIMEDGTGTLLIGNTQYTGTKRVHVHEEIKHFCSSCEGYADTVNLFIDSYYWFASDTSTIPLLTYRETRKYFDQIYLGFYQEIIQSPINTAFDIEAFRQLVNLRVTPNPSTGSTVVISYTLPDNAATVLSFDNSVTGLHSTIQGLNQSAGNYSLTYNIDSYLSGSYTVSLNIGGVLVSRNLVINH